ncbi:MAG: hypothetical protein ACLFWG_02150 [Longimicrobiales bacterium]
MGDGARVPPGRLPAGRLPAGSPRAFRAGFADGFDRSRAAVVLIALVLAWGCTDEPPVPSEEAPVDSVARESAPTETTRTYERVLAFATLEGGAPAVGPAASPGTTTEGLEPPAADQAPEPEEVEAPSDTMLVVPIFFLARTTREGVLRSIRGRVGRGASWEPFAEEEWLGPASRTPWRIVPRGPVRLVVGDGGALETVIFRDPPRLLELDLGEQLAEWTGTGGSTFRLEASSVLLGSRTFDGITLDMARGQDLADGAPGDWAFLVSGDSLQLVLESPTQAPPGTDSAFRAYGRVDFRQLQWPEITVDWSETRAYEPARRDVPAAWRFRATGPGGPEISGSFSSRSAQLAAGSGEGPVLPVDALFIVSGTIVLEGSEYPVQGLYRHRRE